MKYIIKNKIISMGGASTVKDDYGKDLFFIRGKMFSPTKVKKVRTLDKRVLFKIRNKFFFFILPKVYIMDANGNKILMMKKKKFFSRRNNFEFVPMNNYGQNISIGGDIIGRHYDILRNGTPVAHIRRNFNLIKDSFWMETNDDMNAPFYIAIVIAVDNYFDRVLNQSR